MAREANLPSLTRHLAGCRTDNESSLNHFFSSEFLCDMVLANSAISGPQATHDRGGVLDLILVDKAATIQRFSLGAKGMASSDHRMVMARVHFPAMTRPTPRMWWKTADKPCWKCFQEDLEQPLATWHKWFKSASQEATNAAPKGLHRRILTEAAAFFSIIVLGTLWRCDSPYGRLTNGTTSPKRGGGTGWWNGSCTAAMKQLERNRGTLKEGESKRQFRDTMLQTRQNFCRDAVEAIEKAVGDCNQIDAHTAKQVKSHIRLMRSASRLMKAGETIIGIDMVEKIWPAYFQAQSSFDGPKSPSELLAGLQAAQTEIIPEGKELSVYSAVDQETVDPVAEDLAEVRREYPDEDECGCMPIDTQ